MNRRLAILALLTAAFGSSAQASEPKKKGGGVGYTAFPMISVFTRGRGTKHGTLSMEVGLFADDPKLVDQIKLYRPRLMDAYVTKLQTYAGGLSTSSLVDPDYISGQLQTATDQVLGRKGARLLLGSILLN